MSFAAFFERARTEAERYGPDPWVFVRELLQNARDAGATRVELSTEIIEGHTRVRCRDNGEGMSFAHAGDYLFTLYRSSKESDASSVGKFGVGFWSVLRFRPETITIRSHHERDEAWEIILREGSPRAAQRRPTMPRGTDLILERPGEDQDVLRRLRDAAIQNGRYLTQRDRPETPLEISVQGELINAPFTLPAPRASFSWRGVRGVVSLGDTPRVELFSRGLRVRAASCLEDLLSSERASDKARVQFPSIDGVLAPQAILESDQLELLLARSDAREDEALRKLVRRAQKELRGLVRQQLAALSPPSVRERLSELMRDINEAPIWAQVTGAMVGGALLALLAAPLIWQLAHTESPALTPGPSPLVRVVNERGGPTSYHDISAEYRGPQVSPLDPATASSVRLVYSPAEMNLHFGALAVAHLDGSGSISAELLDPLESPYPRVECDLDERCVSVRLEIDQIPGAMRVPLPVGHVLVRDSLRLVGASTEQVQAQLQLSRANEAVLILTQAFSGTLAYQSTPVGEVFDSAPSTVGPQLPPELSRVAQGLSKIAAVEAKVEAATKAVSERIAYSVDVDVSKAHATAIARGDGLIERALAIGAGDCDVQNGVLALLLADAGIEARLVVGLVGRRGRANPWLHAWVEWRDTGGSVHFADASEGATIAPLATQEFPPLPATTPVAGSVSAEGPTTPSSDPNPDSGTLVSNSGPSSSWPTLTAWTQGYDRRGVLLAIAALLLLSLLALVMAAWVLFGGGRPAIALAGKTSLGELLQGALRQPLAFRHLPELFTRQLVPTLHGPALSLGEARALARSGRLFSGGAKHGLPGAAAKKGACVIDLGKPEGRAVAGTLGAVDLEELAIMRQRGTCSHLLEEVESLLRSAGCPWELLIVQGLDRSLRSINLAGLGLAGRGRVRRVLLLAAEDSTWIRAADEHLSSPATASFAMLDELLSRLDLPAQRRGELLAEAAAQATLEMAAAPSLLRPSGGDA